MKTIFALALVVIISVHAGAQSPAEYAPVNVTVINELSGQPVDVDLKWYDSSLVKRLSIGKYLVQLPAGREESLLVSGKGYFDQEAVLDYSTVKETPNQEIRVQPTVPQVEISIMDSNTGKPLGSTIELFTMDESVLFNEEVSQSPHLIDLEYNTGHILQVRRDGYFSFRDTINYNAVFDGRKCSRSVRLVPIKSGSKILLVNKYFSADERELSALGKLMLDALIPSFQQRKSLVVELGEYPVKTNGDAEGHNLAMAVKQYLEEKGVDGQQLITKVYKDASARKSAPDAFVAIKVIHE